MLYEYALDPKLFKNWQDFRYLIEKFGMSEGRLISQFPKKWKRIVYESLGNCSQGEKKRIEALLNRNIFVKRIYNQLDKESDWLTNAINAHENCCFRAIISTDNPTDHPYVLKFSTYFESNESLMQVSRTIRIERKALKMAYCVKTLLQFGKEIIFVDPHFAPQNKRYYRPLAEFLKLIASRCSGIPIHRLEYHCNDDLGESYLKGKCDENLPKNLSAEFTPKLVQWPKKELHNRYILTDIGGVMFGTGLDDDNDGESTPTDDVTLLDEFVYKQYWKKYRQGMAE